MRVSKLVAKAAEARQPIPAPSPVHVAFVNLLGQLMKMGSQHPAARFMARLAPSILTDLAEVPGEQLAKWCGELSTALATVANAYDYGGEGAPVPDMLEAAQRALTEEDHDRNAIEAAADPVADQPALSAG